MSAPIVLILGAGSNIGSHVAKAFAERGYSIAMASRNPKKSETNPAYHTFQGDLSDVSSVSSIFTQVRKALGHPSVVVYNGML